MDKNKKQTEINKYEKFMHWLWRQKSITELVLNIGMDGIAKKYVKERVSANSSHDAPAALPLQNVSQQRELLLAYEKYGCTDEYWQQEGEKFAKGQVDSFLSQRIVVCFEPTITDKIRYENEC